MAVRTSDNQVAQVASEDMRQVVFNLPNQLTWARLVLTVVMFAMISLEYYLASLILFAIAVSTDWLDGYFARKYNLVTTLGRILDPFADKVIICGTFIYLAAIPAVQPYLPPWMVVVVVGRELLVTAIRGFLEQRGADFSASMPGKLKMVFQCLAAGLALYFLYEFSPTVAAEGKAAIPDWLHWGLLLSCWTAVVMTIYSGVGYIVRAVQLLRNS